MHVSPLTQVNKMIQDKFSVVPLYNLNSKYNLYFGYGSLRLSTFI